MGSKTQVVQAPYSNTTTATYGYQSLPGVDPAQAVKDFRDTPTEIDPSVAQRSALREQASQNRWNSDFTSGLPQHLRLQWQDRERRQIQEMGDYERQAAEYARNQQELAKWGTLLPQLVQTGGTSQGYQSQIIQKPSIWSSIIGGAATIGAAALSDGRLKNVEGDSQTGLDEIMALRPVDYAFKPEAGIDAGQPHKGFIAQEVEQVQPESVGEDPASGAKTVDYAPLIATLVRAVQQQQQQIDGLKQERGVM